MMVVNRAKCMCEFFRFSKWNFHSGVNEFKKIWIPHLDSVVTPNVSISLKIKPKIKNILKNEINYKKKLKKKKKTNKDFVIILSIFSIAN